MTWTPPERSGPRSFWWRLGHSAWLLLPILSFGCLSAAGFCYVGIRARREAWWVSGIIYTLLANVCFFVGPELPEDSVWSTLLVVALLCTWMVSVVHAVIINAAWLRWRAAQHPWYLQPQTPAPWPVPAPSAQLPPHLQGLAPPPGHFYGGPGGPQPAAPYRSAPGFPPQPYGDPAITTPGSWLPPPYPGSPAPVPPPVPPDPVPAFGEQAGGRTLFEPIAATLDVNRAEAGEFATLPGIDADRAARIVAARIAHGGFHSVADFTAAAGLAPHEFVAIRDRLTCTPPPPQHVQDQPFGRIVDV
ncbi:MAG TPA: helix-hairpin-helix domain-containing protein [Actinoplanes sp.]|nr:helix-hairpin-helix domain-containing protein [Actinoplanes sp.]